MWRDFFPKRISIIFIKREKPEHFQTNWTNKLPVADGRSLAWPHSPELVIEDWWAEKKGIQALQHKIYSIQSNVHNERGWRINKAPAWLPALSCRTSAGWRWWNWLTELLEWVTTKTHCQILPLPVHFLQQNLTSFPKNLHWLPHWKSFKYKNSSPCNARYHWIWFCFSVPSSALSAPQNDLPKMGWGLRQDHGILRVHGSTGNPLSTKETLSPLSASAFLPIQPSSSLSLLVLRFELSFPTLCYWTHVTSRGDVQCSQSLSSFLNTPMH